MPDEWWAGIIPEQSWREAEVADRLRHELRTPEDCDRFLESIAFKAGRSWRQHKDFVAWAESEGDEVALVTEHKLDEREVALVNEIMGNVKRWRARLVAEAQH
jgi:hypothetical protein